MGYSDVKPPCTHRTAPLVATATPARALASAVIHRLSRASLSVPCPLEGPLGVTD